MRADRVVAALVIGISLSFIHCASGDGVPQGRVQNSLGDNTCIVEAIWIGTDPTGATVDYGWDDPIGNGGLTRTRETTVGSGYACAVVQPGPDCFLASCFQVGENALQSVRRNFPGFHTKIIVTA